MKDAGGFALGILFWVAVWFAVASFVDNDLLLASPLDALASLAGSLAEPASWSAVGTTSLRIVLTGGIAALAGATLGAIGYRFTLVRQLLAPALQVMKSAPVACVIVIVLVAWGASGALTAIVTFVAFPPFYVGIQHALETRPRATESVLRLAGVARWRIFFACTWPAALPFFTAASKTAVALSWRAGITAELLCLPLGTIGSAVYTSKLTLDSAELLVWTIVVMILSWLTEKIVLGLLGLSSRSYRLALRNLPPDASDRTEDRKAEGTQDPPSDLVLENVSKTYAGERIVDGFSLHVEPGERICLMAPTGSGKTTVLRMLLDLATPDGGTIEAPRPLGAVLQESTLASSLSALQNVLLAAAPGASAENIEAALDELLPSDTVNRKATELSGGMKRLTELVRALLSPGRAVILDEPFAGLDAKTHERACAFIRANLGDRPLIVATHDENDAALLEARIVRL